MLYKFHPATRMENFLHLLPPNPRCVDGSLYSATGQASLVLGSGSGALAEAAALGLPVVIIGEGDPTIDEGFNYFPDTGRGQLWDLVTEPEALAECIRALEAFQYTPHAKTLRLQLREQLFTETTPERIRQAFTLE